MQYIYCTVISRLATVDIRGPDTAEVNGVKSRTAVLRLQTALHLHSTRHSTMLFPALLNDPIHVYVCKRMPGNPFEICCHWVHDRDVHGPHHFWSFPLTVIIDTEWMMSSVGTFRLTRTKREYVSVTADMCEMTTKCWADSWVPLEKQVLDGLIWKPSHLNSLYYSFQQLFSIHPPRDASMVLRVSDSLHLWDVCRPLITIYPIICRTPLPKAHYWFFLSSFMSTCLPPFLSLIGQSHMFLSAIEDFESEFHSFTHRI